MKEKKIVVEVKRMDRILKQKRGIDARGSWEYIVGA